NEKKQMEALFKQRQSLDALHDAYNEKQIQLNRVLEAPEVTAAQQALIENHEMDENERSIQTETGVEIEPHPPRLEHRDEQTDTSLSGVSETVHTLEKTMNIIHSLPGFQSFVNELNDKRSKLQN